MGSQLDSLLVTQLMLQIPENHFGRAVSIMVQNKLPGHFRDAVLLSGPNTLVHQRLDCVDSSPLILLSRPLAREGAHSYLELSTCDEFLNDVNVDTTLQIHQQRADGLHHERGYVSALTKDEVIERDELTMDEGYAVLELHLQKLTKPKEAHEKKRKMQDAFPLSPEGPRLQQQR